MEQMKWVTILIISHNIRTNDFPANLSRAILKASRRKSFFICHRVVSWYSPTACGESHPQAKGFRKHWLSECRVGGTSVWSSACSSHLQSPKSADFCELRNIANSRSLCSHPFPVTLFLCIRHRSRLETAGDISRLTQTAAFKTQNVYSLEHWWNYFAVKCQNTEGRITQQPLWRAETSFKLLVLSANPPGTAWL